MITIKTKYSIDNKSNIAYLNYIATREGVKLELSDDHVSKPVSQKQKDLLKQLFKDDAFDDDLKELKSFRDKPSSYTASELISRGLDYALNVDNKVYLNYIATRDGVVVEPTTKHGLFDLEGTADLKSFKEFMSNYNGRVYKMIISLPYNSDFREKEKWETLIRSSHAKFAKVFNRNASEIAWVGAVHEASNPHVHLMIWSKTEKELNLNNTEFKKAMERLKITFAQRIYKDEFRELNQSRQETMQGLRSELMKHLKLYNEGILRDGLDTNTFYLMQEYAQDIPDVKYGYQSPENKAKINQILVSLIEHHPDLYKMLEALVENQSKRIDYYNISKDVDKKDHIEQFIQKLFYPSKNDKPILQNIVITELQSISVTARDIEKNVVEPTTKEINKFKVPLAKEGQLLKLIKTQRDEYFKGTLPKRVQQDLQITNINKQENKFSDSNQAEKESKKEILDFKNKNTVKQDFSSTGSVVEPTTSRSQTLGLKLGKGLMRSMMQISMELEMTYKQAFIQNKKHQHQNQNKKIKLAHRLEREEMYK
ncbi:hypothetical protein [Erysipelothrix rhusiopathiae]|uniref:hypothetical protein n=1 Tax=Erysipelothrix rhusiopathiae TaxID=1648 RepID=UPI00248194ED|nr:hypothetical protein [Erysipelothrix rhusiopathiae]